MVRHSNRFKKTSTKGKRQRISLFILFCSLFLVAWILACRQKAPTTTKTGVKTPAENVAVTVNGLDIVESDVEAWVDSEIKKIGTKATQLPPEFLEQYKKQLREKALDVLVVEKLLNEQVKQAKIVVTEDEVINRISKMLAAQQPQLTLQEFQKMMEERGQNFVEYKKEFRKQLSYLKLVEPLWSGKINITDDDANNYYSENQKEFETPEQTRASHILITPDISDPNTDPNQAKAKAKAKAEGLLKQIKEGADFAELAKANSNCPSAAKGGDLDFFSKGQMLAPFENAAFALKPGQISDIVETKYGYHIIKVTDHKDASILPFEQVKDKIKYNMTQKKQSELAQEYVDSLKDKAYIEYPMKKEQVYGK